jgi:hypothetical protein
MNFEENLKELKKLTIELELLKARGKPEQPKPTDKNQHLYG